MILNYLDELTNDQLDEFRKICFKVSGHEISKDKVEQEALSLIRFIALVIDNH